VPAPATRDIEPGPALARLLREDAAECD